MGVTWPAADPSTLNYPATQGPRVQSFSTEVAAGATSPPLTWTAPRPGTYLLESGTHPSIQGAMGLYGIVVVTDAATGTAYPAVTVGATRPAVTYNADIALLFSEIRPSPERCGGQGCRHAGLQRNDRLVRSARWLRKFGYCKFRQLLSAGGELQAAVLPHQRRRVRQRQMPRHRCS